MNRTYVTLLSQFLTAFLQALDVQAISYCILRNYEGLPEYTSNDIDLLIASDRMEEVVSLLRKLAEKENFGIHMIAEFSCLAMAFHSKVFYGAQVHIDLFTKISWRGFAMLNPEQILKTRMPYNGFYIPGPKYEQAINLLTRLLYHGYVKEVYREKIHETALHPQDGPAFLTVLENSLGKREGHCVWEAARKAQWETIEGRMRSIRAALILRNLIRNPSGLIECQILEFGRLVRRLIHPAGVSVAIIGPDGAGKSSVIYGLRSLLQATFSDKQHIVHWRPELFKSNRASYRGPVTKPHGKLTRNKGLSLFFLCYHTLLFVMGYWWVIFPRRFRGWLLWLDRYYFDFFVDPKRFRLAVSKFWVCLGYVLVPNPDLLILLDAPPEVLQARKQEVPFEETDRQRKAYLELVRVMKNGVVVDASRPLDDVVAEVNRVILDFMAERTRKRLGR